MRSHHPTVRNKTLITREKKERVALNRYHYETWQHAQINKCTLVVLHIAKGSMFKNDNSYTSNVSKLGNADHPELTRDM